VGGSGARPEPQIWCAQPLPISHCPQHQRSRAGRTSRSARARGLRGRRAPPWAHGRPHPTCSATRPRENSDPPTAAPNGPRENSGHEARSLSLGNRVGASRASPATWLQGRTGPSAPIQRG